MKFSSLLFFSFLFLMFANEISARKGVEDYWKVMMKDQPIPEVINGIVDEKTANPTEEKRFWTHFKKDFDVTSNAIIYHPHQEEANHLPASATSSSTKPELHGGADQQ